MLRIVVIANPSDPETLGACLESVSRGVPDIPCSVFHDTDIGDAEGHDLLEVDIDLADRLSCLSCIEIAGKEFTEDWLLLLDPRTRVEGRFGSAAMASLCSRAPLHAPVLCDFEDHTPIRSIGGVPAGDFARCLHSGGIGNEPAYCSKAFLVLKRIAIPHICDLAIQFCATALKAGLLLSGVHGLGYAMQVLCADTSRHRTLGPSGVCRWRPGGTEDAPLRRAVFESLGWPESGPAASGSPALLSTTMDVDFALNHDLEPVLR
jgi:hypothetical protein